MNNEQIIYLSTGIDHLDDLLSPDRKDKSASGGILIAKTKKASGSVRSKEKFNRNELETPIAVIEGTTGTGKTTLALQIAHAAARNPQWIVFFYSLEQTIPSLLNVAQNFGYFKKNDNDAVVDFVDLSELDEKLQFLPEKAKIHFCQFSPRPFTETEEKDIFEQRMSELDHVLNVVTSQTAENTLILLVLDSITALSGRPLQRNEIYRLFTLLRNYHIPSLISLERYSDYSTQYEEVSFECTRFLADVVISLTKEYREGYLQYYLEIIKSRIGRQALGKHLYKIRTQPQLTEQKAEGQTGLLVYRSIHYMLTKVREQKQTTSLAEFNFKIDAQTEQDLGLVFTSSTIKTNSFTAIIGPNGTHKLALGLNLAMGRLEGKKPKLLIINFGSTSEFGFQGVAWTEFNKDWRKLVKAKNGAQYVGGLFKFWHSHYYLDEVPADSEPIITVTAFKIGQLTPEECFDVIDNEIEKAKSTEHPFTSVLLNNTAELCTGYPLLKNEPLFLPTLIDLFVLHGLTSVGIGVEETGESEIRDANVTLLANADYRIILSHYPNVNEFSEKFIQKVMKGEKPELEEQLVWLVIDNVTGKHYRRQPRWLWVEEIPDATDPSKISHKILHCEEIPKFRAGKNRKNV